MISLLYIIGLVICLVAIKLVGSAKRITYLTGYIILIILSCSMVIHLLQSRNLSPRSVVKRLDSPYPLNAWDSQYLLELLRLPLKEFPEPLSLWWPHDCSIGDYEYTLIPQSLRQKLWTAILPGSDNFVCKTRLASIAKKMSLEVQNYLPKSYDFQDKIPPGPSDTIYIAKSNQQRQQGVHIFKRNTPNKDLPGSVAVIQELLGDPLLIEGHKSTFRVYTLAWVQKKQTPKVWIYGDGFIYYTAKLYDATSSSPECHVASGYNDRSLYKTLPMTHNEFYEKYVPGKGKATFQKLFSKCVGTVLKAFLCKSQSLIHRDNLGSFQLFGADLQVNSGMTEVRLLEFNKCPNLEPMDDGVDFGLKRDMSLRMWNLLGPFMNLPCVQSFTGDVDWIAC